MASDYLQKHSSDFYLQHTPSERNSSLINRVNCSAPRLLTNPDSVNRTPQLHMLSVDEENALRSGDDAGKGNNGFWTPRQSQNEGLLREAYTNSLESNDPNVAGNDPDARDQQISEEQSELEELDHQPVQRLGEAMEDSTFRGTSKPRPKSAIDIYNIYDDKQSDLQNLANDLPSFEIRREAQPVTPLDYRNSLDDSRSSSNLGDRERDSLNKCDSPPMLDVLPTPNAFDEGPMFDSNASSHSDLATPSFTLENLRSESTGNLHLNSTESRTNTLSSGKRYSKSMNRRSSYYDFRTLGNQVFPELSQGSTTPSSSQILPKLKTIDLYRKNARKSNDPELEFQLAQYIMQTALTVTSESQNEDKSSSLRSATPRSRSVGSISEISQQESNKAPNADSALTSLDTTEGSHLSSLSTETSLTQSTASLQLKVEDGNKEKAAEAKLISRMFKEAVNSLKRLAERGHADSQYLLGDLYASKAIGKPDMERSFRYFLMAAKHGHAESAYRAALCLQEGWGTPRSSTKALQFYRTAAFKNQPGALYQMGMLFFYGGMGIDDNTTNRLQGVKWLSRGAKVADNVYNRAPHELAKIYEVGYKDLVFQDEPYAARLYAKSAELGYIPSAARLGKAYEFGEIQCPQDPALSIHYYTQAALANDANSQLSLCAWYMVGAGPSFPVNHEEAYEWALRAAFSGLAKGQYTVGFFLEQGIGVHQNIVESTKWYKRASAGGYAKADEKLKGLGVTDNNSKKQKCTIM